VIPPKLLRAGPHGGVLPHSAQRADDLSRKIDVRALWNHRQRHAAGAEWEGHVTLGVSNTTPLPAKIYANEGVAQMLFLESDEVCEIRIATGAESTWQRA